MAEITAATVKELRERTGAGMMDCKKALGETDGDMEAAIDWLRTKGLAAAAKKAGRTAAEGLVGVAVDGNKGAIVEVNSRDRLRRQERAVPGFRPHRRGDHARHRQRHRGAEGRLLAGRRHRRGEADQQHRDDRRESVDPPRRAARGRGGRDRLLRPQCGGPGPRQDRRAGRARERRRQGRARGARQAARHAHRRGQPAGAARRGARPGAGRARARHRQREGGRDPASRPRSSRRWSRARWPSSARRMRCCRSSS